MSRFMLIAREKTTITLGHPGSRSRHRRPAGRARRTAERRQRDGAGGSRPRPSERAAATSASVRHHRRVRLPVVAILLAAYLIELQWVMLIGAAYLLWLPFQHFT